MVSTYVNNLRLEEMATGEKSGTWGGITNTTLELVGQALGYGTRAIANASTDNITIADGAADADRSMYLKLTGGGQACTVTLLPNTSSKMWIMENATSYTLTFTQGSGANVAVKAGQTKMIFADGLGSGAVVYELGTFSVKNIQADGTVTVGIDDTGYDVTFFGATSGKKMVWDESADTLVVTGAATTEAFTASGLVTANAKIDLNGTELILDADADTSITADTDDTIDVRIAGADDFQFTANTFTAVSGSTIATNTIAETTSTSGVTIDGLLVKDSKIELADGTAALPSLSNSGDVNTGIYFPAADTVGVSLAGALDFQFEANDFTALSGSVISTNTINETTAASGVTIDGLLIKDAVVTGDINFGQDTLDYFDYGTFTPSATIDGDVPATVGSLSGSYIRIGKVVYFVLNMTVNRDAGETGALIYTGLPFTGTSSGQNWPSVTAMFNDNAFGFNTSVGFFQPLVRPATGDIYIYGAPTSITAALTGMDAANVLRAANNAAIYFGGFYRI